MTETRLTNDRPTRADLAAAADRLVPDLIAPSLRVLFCGINPGLYSAATGHHFARPGNRFWPTLHAAGFTPRLLVAADEHELLARGYGITNIVDRASAAADELTPEELRAGRAKLERKIKRFQPRVLAVLGVGAYRTAFDRKRATLGLQPEALGSTAIWVLPNPSGLNAHFQLKDLARLYRELLTFAKGS